MPDALTVPACPGCGAALEPIALEGGHPPWGCFRYCSRSWWPSELTPAGRASWDDVTKEHTDPDVVAAMEDDAMAAAIRGTSVDVDTVSHLDDASLATLEKVDRIGKGMRGLITAEIARRKKKPGKP